MTEMGARELLAFVSLIPGVQNARQVDSEKAGCVVVKFEFNLDGVSYPDGYLSFVHADHHQTSSLRGFTGGLSKFPPKVTRFISSKFPGNMLEQYVFGPEPVRVWFDVTLEDLQKVVTSAK